MPHPNCRPVLSGLLSLPPVPRAAHCSFLANYTGPPYAYGTRPRIWAEGGSSGGSLSLWLLSRTGFCQLPAALSSLGSVWAHQASEFGHWGAWGWEHSGQRCIAHNPHSALRSGVNVPSSGSPCTPSWPVLWGGYLVLSKGLMLQGPPKFPLLPQLRSAPLARGALTCPACLHSQSWGWAAPWASVSPPRAAGFRWFCY